MKTKLKTNDAPFFTTHRDPQGASATCGCKMWKEGDDWMFHHCKAHEACYFVEFKSTRALQRELESSTVDYKLNRLYKLIVKQAKRFAAEVDGDFSFAKNEVNFLCVEHMTMGWIYAQEWFQNAVKSTMALYKRENIALVVNDIALQATTDATHGIKRFKY